MYNQNRADVFVPEYLSVVHEVSVLRFDIIYCFPFIKWKTCEVWCNVQRCAICILDRLGFIYTKILQIVTPVHTSLTTDYGCSQVHNTQLHRVPSRRCSDTGNGTLGSKELRHAATEKKQKTIWLGWPSLKNSNRDLQMFNGMIPAP